MLEAVKCCSSLPSHDKDHSKLGLYVYDINLPISVQGGVK